MADETEDVSPELKALREELGIVTNIFFALGNMPIKANEAEKAAEILRYVDRLVVKAQDAVNSRIATEALGKPMQMTGSVLSVAKDEASH